MTPDELFKMPSNKCICLISGLKPFYSTKFDITDHKRYRLIADTQEDYFDVKKYLLEKRANKFTATKTKHFNADIMNYSA